MQRKTESFALAHNAANAINFTATFCKFSRHNKASREILLKKITLICYQAVNGPITTHWRLEKISDS